MWLDIQLIWLYPNAIPGQKKAKNSRPSQERNLPPGMNPQSGICPQPRPRPKPKYACPKPKKTNVCAVVEESKCDKGRIS
jgi:hypothetical protein